MNDFSKIERMQLSHEACLETIRLQDARIAELTAEVAFLRDALVAIEIAGTLPLTSEYVADIARNALKEGK